MDVPMPGPLLLEVKQEDSGPPVVVIDLADYVSNEERVANWNMKVRSKVMKSFGIENQKDLESLVKWYMNILNEDILDVEACQALITYMDKHLQYFYHYFKQLNWLYTDDYLDIMEDILAFYIHSEGKLYLKKEEKRSLKRIRRKILKLLRIHLLMQEHRIHHVLMKLKFTPSTDGARNYLDNIYLVVLSQEPVNKSDLGFCRAYIVYKKWKALQDPKEWHKLDTLLYESYSRPHGSISTNPVWKQIVSENSSILDLLVHMSDDDQIICDLYFKYIKSHTAEDNITDIDVAQIDFDRNSPLNFTDLYNDDETNEFQTLMKNCSQSDLVENIDSDDDCEIVGESSLNTNPGEIIFEIIDDDDDDDVVEVPCVDPKETSTDNRVTSTKKKQKEMSFFDFIHLSNEHGDSEKEPAPTDYISSLDPKSENLDNDSVKSREILSRKFTRKKDSQHIEDAQEIEVQPVMWNETNKNALEESFPVFAGLVTPPTSNEDHHSYHSCERDFRNADLLESENNDGDQSYELDFQASHLLEIEDNEVRTFTENRKEAESSSHSPHSTFTSDYSPKAKLYPSPTSPDISSTCDPNGEEEPDQLVEEPEQLVDEPEQLEEEPEQLVEESEQLVEEPEQLVEEPQQPVEEPQQPVEEPQQPVEEPQQPVEEPQQSVEEPGQLVEVPEQLVQVPEQLVEEPFADFDDSEPIIGLRSELPEVAEPNHLEQPEELRESEPIEEPKSIDVPKVVESHEAEPDRVVSPHLPSPKAALQEDVDSSTELVRFNGTSDRVECSTSEELIAATHKGQNFLQKQLFVTVPRLAMGRVGLRRSQKSPEVLYSQKLRELDKEIHHRSLIAANHKGHNLRQKQLSSRKPVLQEVVGSSPELVRFNGTPVSVESSSSEELIAASLKGHTFLQKQLFVTVPRLEMGRVGLQKSQNTSEIVYSQKLRKLDNEVHHRYDRLKEHGLVKTVNMDDVAELDIFRSVAHVPHHIGTVLPLNSSSPSNMASPPFEPFEPGADDFKKYLHEFQKEKNEIDNKNGKTKNVADLEERCDKNKNVVISTPAKTNSVKRKRITFGGQATEPENTHKPVMDPNNIPISGILKKSEEATPKAAKMNGLSSPMVLFRFNYDKSTSRFTGTDMMYYIEPEKAAWREDSKEKDDKVEEGRLVYSRHNNGKRKEPDSVVAEDEHIIKRRGRPRKTPPSAKTKSEKGKTRRTPKR